MSPSSSSKDPSSVSDAILAPGVVLAERFRIERAVGRGADGVVYRAIDLRLSEAVALKTLRRDAADARKLEGLLRELQLARRVTHRNVCRLHDLVETTFAGRPLLLLSMELLSGQTLRSYLNRRGRLSERTTLSIVQQIAAGLDEAHRAGVVHGDLSARNIFLERAQTMPRDPSNAEQGDDEIGRVVITDFGLARSTLKQPKPPAGSTRNLHETTDEELAETLTEEIAGTPAYMAPEQLRGASASPRSDVYALSVLTYEMLTGSLPFQGKTSLETALQRLVAEPPIASEVMPSLGPQWSPPLARGMSRQPADRPPSATALVHEIRGSSASHDGASAARARFRLAARPRAVAWAVLLLSAVSATTWLAWRAASSDDRSTVGSEELSRTSNPIRPSSEALSANTSISTEAALAGGAADARAPSRLAVLPFRTDEHAAAGYLAHAVALQLRQALGQLPGIGVFSPASADVIARQLEAADDRDAQNLTQDFGLRWMVQGEVVLDRPASSDDEEQVVISVQLSDLLADRGAISETFRQPLSQAFDLQASVSTWVTENLKPEIDGSSPPRADPSPAPDLLAYQNWARGLQFYYGTYGIGGVAERRAGLERARTLFDSAARRDPRFAQAIAWSALCDLTESLLPGADDELLRRAGVKARRVLDGNSESTEANAVLGFVVGIGGDLELAERHFARALEVSPGSALVHGLRAQLLERARLWELAAEEAALAAELDPFNPMMLQLAAGSFLVLRAYQRADALYATAIDRFPEHPLFYGGRAVNLFYWKGDTHTARELLDQVPASAPGDYLTAWFFMIERDFDAALEELGGIAEPIWDAELYQPKELLRAFCLRQLGRENEALRALQAADATLDARGGPSESDPRVATTRAAIAALQARPQESRAYLQRSIDTLDLPEEALEHAALAQATAWVHALLGQHDEALDLLFELFEGPANISRQALLQDPRWDALRSHPRFPDLLTRAEIAERVGADAGRSRGLSR